MNDMEIAKEFMTKGILVLLAIAFIIIVPMVFKSGRRIKEIYGENEAAETKTIKAKIILKNAYSPKYTLEQINFIVFELENGERIELAIKNNDVYKMLFEGDVGKLTFSGKRYISFERCV